ncbi:MAG TPA: transposase [Acidobacteriota bacterium]|jgi:transposase-like protein
MPNRGYSVDQILEILRRVETRLNEGSDVIEICRELEISEQSYYRWRKLYGGASVAEAPQIQKMTRENATLRRLVAEQAVNIDILKDIASKKW